MITSIEIDSKMHSIWVDMKELQVEVTFEESPLSFRWKMPCTMQQEVNRTIGTVEQVDVVDRGSLSDSLQHI
jgi:hypothetical protein